MSDLQRQIGSATAVIAVVLTLAVALYAQEPSAIYLLVLDKAGVPILDVNPSSLKIEEDAGTGTIVSVKRVGWPMRLTVLVDNGPATAEALVHLRNGLIKLVEGIPRTVPVSIITTAPNPRWLIRDSKDLIQIKNAVGRLTPDTQLARFSDALGEFAERLDREFRGVETDLPPYLPVLVSIATTNVDGSEVLRERNEKMLLSLRKHRVWTHLVMVTPGRATNEPGEVSNVGVDDGQNAEIAHLVQKVTGGHYIPVSATTALATNILPTLAQQISLKYLKQMTQHRIEFLRAPGASGPMKNFKLTLSDHPGASLIVSTDGNLP